MTDDQLALSRFRGEARLFPLPNLVLFPHAVQGLHIFEPRYRQLTADALATDQLMALVLLIQDADEVLDEPVIEEVACLGRITHYEQLPDGRYNLRLKGIARLKLIQEIVTDKLYRVAHAEILPELAPANLAELTQLRRELAKAILPRFEPTGPAFQHLKELFQGDMPLGELCDTLAFALPLPTELKQYLLSEPHVDRRAATLANALRLPTPNPNRKFPPEFSLN